MTVTGDEYNCTSVQLSSLDVRMATLKCVFHLISFGNIISTETVRSCVEYHMDSSVIFW